MPSSGAADQSACAAAEAGRQLMAGDCMSAGCGGSCWGFDFGVLWERDDGVPTCCRWMRGMQEKGPAATFEEIAGHHDAKAVPAVQLHQQCACRDQKAFQIAGFRTRKRRWPTLCCAGRGCVQDSSHRPGGAKPASLLQYCRSVCVQAAADWRHGCRHAWCTGNAPTVSASLWHGQRSAQPTRHSCIDDV